MKGIQSGSDSHSKQTRGAELGSLQSSILLRQHDRDHPLGDRGIGGIGRVHGHALIEVIDFEHDRVTVGLERPKIVFLVRVIGVAIPADLPRTYVG